MKTTDVAPDPLVVPATVEVPGPIDHSLRLLTLAANHGKLWFAAAGVLAAIGKRQRRAGLRGMVSLGGASFLANSVIKPLVGRRRPDPARTSTARRIGRLPWTSSFPSGHAASAAAFATGVALESPGSAAVVAPIAAAVAYSRVHVGVHYPSDVIAGAALGAGVALAGHKLWPAKPYEPTDMADGSAPALPDGDGLTVVLNSESGSSDGADEQISALLPKATLVRWDPETDLDEAVGAGMRALGVAGGDGTVASVADLALRRGLPLAVFPAGTLNHFAGALGLNTHNDTADAVQDGSAGRVDVAMLADKVFLNTAGIGGYPEMVKRRDALSHRIGKWPAAAVALWRTVRGHEPLDLEINGQRLTVWAVFVGNGAYTPRGLAPAWRDHMADGILDAQYLRADARFSRTVAVVASLLGLVERTKVFGAIQAPELRIVSHSGPLPSAHDGEVRDAETTMTLRILPDKLTVYRP